MKYFRAAEIAKLNLLEIVDSNIASKLFKMYFYFVIAGIRYLINKLDKFPKESQV